MCSETFILKYKHTFTSISDSVPVPSVLWRRSSAPRWGTHAWSWRRHKNTPFRFTTDVGKFTIGKKIYTLTFSTSKIFNDMSTNQLKTKSNFKHYLVCASWTWRMPSAAHLWSRPQDVCAVWLVIEPDRNHSRIILHSENRPRSRSKIGNMSLADKLISHKH